MWPFNARGRLPRRTPAHTRAEVGAALFLHGSCGADVARFRFLTVVPQQVFELMCKEVEGFSDLVEGMGPGYTIGCVYKCEPAGLK